jgi:hypothetical protein
LFTAALDFFAEAMHHPAPETLMDNFRHIQQLLADYVLIAHYVSDQARALPRVRNGLDFKALRQMS